MTGPREALRRWLIARIQPRDSSTLAQRNIYIVPTRSGLAFGLTLVLLLLASINYQLNLGYALTFLLAGSALASMHMTHASLRGLSLHLRPPNPVFAGQALGLEIVLTNPGRERYGVGLGTEPMGGNEAAQLAWCEVPAASQTHVSVACLAARRGRIGLPLLRIESRFPFGLFRAWSLWRPAGEAWVYPRPEAAPAELPAPEPLASQGASTAPTSTGEFDGVRPWREGDGLRQVVWKKVASTGQLISRDGRQSQRQQLWLDWRHTPPGDPEARLSRLAAWVLLAEARGLHFGLRLPGRELPCGEGRSQREAALQCLAEWS